MRRVCSIILTMAALGCLLTVWTSPAWTYYPPLAATATFAAHSVTRQVYDPKLQQNLNFTKSYPRSDQEVVSLQQEIGVIAWVHRSNTNYYVTCCVYDPALNTGNPGSQPPFQEDTRGPFTSVSQLQVTDGVVAFVAGIAGHFEFRYATYDPAKQAWQMRSWSDTGLQNLVLGTKDGVVVFLYEASGNYWLWADIYDPIQGQWGFGGAQGLYSPNPFSYLVINNATVIFHTVMSGIDVWDTFGYFMGQGWHMGDNTPPRAYFVARPTSGPASLWVWFTDMSIGASTWSWNFGDGNSSTSRSPYHHYDNKGTYVASQSVNAGASHYESTIKVSGAGIAPLLQLLLNN